MLKKAFSDVKADITELKRASNKSVFRVDEITGIIGTLTAKEEFYRFIDTLSSKLDQLEKTFAEKREVDQLARNAADRIDSLKKQLSQRENLVEDLRTIRNVRAKLTAVEISSATRKELHGELAKIQESFAAIRKQLSREATLQKYDADLKDFKSQFTILQKDAVTWKPFSAQLKKVDEALRKQHADTAALSEALHAVQDEAARIIPLQEQMTSLRVAIQQSDAAISALRDNAVDKKHFEEKLREMRSRLDALASSIESSLVEADLSQYATHEQLKSVAKKLQSDFASNDKVEKMNVTLRDFSRYGIELGKLAEKMQRLEANVSETQKTAVASTSVEDIRRELKALQKSVESIPLDELRSDFESFQRQTVSESEFSELRDDITALQKTFESARTDAKKIKNQSRTYADDSDLKALKQNVKYLLDNMASVSDVRQQAQSFSNAIDDLKSNLKDVRKETKAEVKAATKSIPKTLRQEARKPGSGIWSRVSRTVIDFFTEEVPEELPAKEKKPEREPPKQDEGNHSTLITLGGVLFVLLILGGLYYFSQATVPSVGDTVAAGPPVNETESGAVTPEPMPVPGELTNETDVLPENAATSIAEANATAQEDAIVAEPSAAAETAGAPAAAEENETNDEQTASEAAFPRQAVSEEPAAEQEKTLEEKQQDCVDALECEQTDDSQYWYDCYFDTASDICRCYKGLSNKCMRSAEGEKKVQPNESFLSKYKIHLIALIIAAIGAALLFGRGKEEEPQQPRGNNDPKQKKMKDSSSEGDVVDLKDFFQEKK